MRIKFVTQDKPHATTDLIPIINWQELNQNLMPQYFVSIPHLLSCLRFILKAKK